MRSTVAGLSAIILWSSTVALARRIAEQLGPLTAGSAVYLIAALLLTGYRLAKDRPVTPLHGLSRKYVFGCGALFVLYTVSFFVALGSASDRTQAVEVGLLNYLWPSLTLLFSIVILGNTARLGLIPGTLLALGGVFVVVTQGTLFTWSAFLTRVMSHPTAYGLGLLAAVTWALYSNLARRWGSRQSAGAVPLFLLASGVVFGLMRLSRFEQSAWTFRAVAEVSLLGLATGLGYVFWDLAMRKGNIVLVGACSYVTPFLSTVASCVYLGVRPGAQLWLGCVLVVGGAFVSWISIRPADGENSGAPQVHSP